MSMINLKGNVTEFDLIDVNGKDLLQFTVAENHGYYEEDNNWIETGTTYHNCELWGGQALNMSELLILGCGVIVQGSQTTKVNIKDDKKYYNVKVNVTVIGFLPNRIESIAFKPAKPQKED